MQNLVLYTLAGANIINECLGVMDSILVTSFEKWILDEELLERVHCLEKGFHQMASENAVESIKAVGSGGSYLMHPSTMANCRNVWMPAVSDWNSYDAWKKNGGIDILQKAHQRFKQRMESGCGKGFYHRNSPVSRSIGCVNPLPRLWSGRSKSNLSLVIRGVDRNEITRTLNPRSRVRLPDSPPLFSGPDREPNRDRRGFR